MARRLAICIGVDRAGLMPPLKAAVKGAREFEQWAQARGLDTTLLVDETKKVRVADIYDLVEACVTARNCEQLILFFSGHGFLQAPGSEFWLMSGGPDNPNEAISLFRSIEDARMCGVPHVVFISDACRSYAQGPPLSIVTGGVIFPPPKPPTPGEVDVFYATLPGDPSWELPAEDAAKGYSAVFTDSLLGTVRTPDEALVDEIGTGGAALTVVTSRKLKNHLEATVPVSAGNRDPRIRQTPQVRVETALPKYFGTVDAGSVRRVLGALAPTATPAPSFAGALRALSATHFDETTTRPARGDALLAERLGLGRDIEELWNARGRRTFETRTGFTVHGAEPVEVAAAGWRADAPFHDPPNDATAWHIRLWRNGAATPAHSVAIRYRAANGSTFATLLAALDEYIANVVVDDAGRVTSVSYVPAENSTLWSFYAASAERLGKMRAYATVASRNGSFFVSDEPAIAFADRIRQDKGLDPSLGIYAAYAYLQAGARPDVVSVYQYMADDPMRPVPFDVTMLAARSGSAAAGSANARYAPFAPMLAQGWALLLDARDPLIAPIHARLRPHLLPSLWTTLDNEGARIALEHVRSG